MTTVTTASISLVDAKMLIECLSKDLTKPVLQCAYFDGKHAYSTDGHRLFRCEYKHDSTPFILSRAQLMALVKGLRKGTRVKIDSSMAAITDLEYPQHIQMLVPASFNHEVKLGITQTAAIIHNIQMLNELPLTALRFEPNCVSINHGIGGRWLSDPHKMDVLNCVTTFNHNYAVPIISLAVEYLNIGHLFDFDRIDVGTELTPVLLRNSVTKSIYLIMPVQRRNQANPFFDA